MELTWLGILVIVILALAGYRGFRRGFVREVVSFFFIFLAIAAAWVINPYVNTFFIENTPVYEKIQESCEEFITASDKSQEETQTEGQESFIEGLELPELLLKGMEANNTDETYQYLAVDSFGGYVSGYLARTIVNGLSFLVSYLLASVIIRVGMFILELIAGLPLIKEANKLTGALVGAAKGIIFVWIAFLVLTVLCSTEVGKAGLDLIENDVFLRVLYEYDIFINFFMKI